MESSNKAREIYNQIWDELYSEVSVYQRMAVSNTKRLAKIMADEMYNYLTYMNADVEHLNFWSDVEDEIEKI